MRNKYDEELSYQDRCLRTLTGKLLFGPAGDRLAVDILERKPGFAGSIDFIHKMNVTELFTVLPNTDTDFEQAETVWYPTHMTMRLVAEELSLEETKTILAEDIAISHMVWTNHSDRPLRLTFSCRPALFDSTDGFVSDGGFFGIHAVSPILRFHIRLGIMAGWNCARESIVLQPGERKEILGAACVGNIAAGDGEFLPERLGNILGRPESPAELMEQFIERNREFYTAAPSFVSDDRLMNACFRYRFYILKNSMCRPGTGRFTETVMYEGRDHRMRKTALHPAGWEFSKLIPLSTPLQVNDLRWHPYRQVTKEIIRSAFAGQDEDGLLLCAYVEESMKSYANYMIWAVWLFYLVDGDQEFVRELLPKMRRYIEGHEKNYTDGKDSLLIEMTHSLTGKEYQPSYWYFHDFPKDPKDKATYTPLKRVDRSIYHYLNLSGLANLLQELGEEEEWDLYRRKAEAVRSDVNDKMWDKDTGFYYDLQYQTGAKSMVRNIVGIYPFWAQIAEAERQEGILPLMDPEAFDTGSAFASVSKDCPAFSPGGGWMGRYMKGRNGCVWCGPSWPYTTGIALEALGNESRRRGHCFDGDFDRLLKEYTVQHFRDGNSGRPYLVEHYDSVTGERLSDEADYNHSFWLDLVISYVAGVIVERDCVRIDPFRTHLKWFSLTGLIIRGHSITILYSKGKDREGIPVGLTVMADGEKVNSLDEQGRLIVKI